MNLEKYEVRAWGCPCPLEGTQMPGTDSTRQPVLFHKHDWEHEPKSHIQSYVWLNQSPHYMPLVTRGPMHKVQG